MVKDNVNGKLFNLKENEDKIGNYIIKIFNNKKCSIKKSINYYKKLSWKTNSLKLRTYKL